MNKVYTNKRAWVGSKIILLYPGIWALHVASIHCSIHPKMHWTTWPLPSVGVPNIIIADYGDKWPCHVQTCILSFSPPDDPSLCSSWPAIFSPWKLLFRSHQHYIISSCIYLGQGRTDHACWLLVHIHGIRRIFLVLDVAFTTRFTDLHLFKL